jgi:chitinase
VDASGVDFEEGAVTSLVDFFAFVFDGPDVDLEEPSILAAVSNET